MAIKQQICSQELEESKRHYSNLLMKSKSYDYSPILVLLLVRDHTLIRLQSRIQTATVNNVCRRREQMAQFSVIRFL